MLYFKFTAYTNYAGCYNVEYVSFDDDVTDLELSEFGENLCYTTAEEYEYAALGWERSFVTEEEEVEEYYENCYYEYEQITKEEYEENS